MKLSRLFGIPGVKWNTVLQFYQSLVVRIRARNFK